MKIDKFLIGLLVSALIIVAGVMVVMDVDKNYTDFSLTAEENDTFADIYQQANKTISESDSIGKQINDKTLGGEVDDTSTWESMLKGSYSAIRLVKNSFGLILSIFTTITDVIGIPPIFTTVAFAAILLSILFALIYLIFRTG